MNCPIHNNVRIFLQIAPFLPGPLGVKPPRKNPIRARWESPAPARKSPRTSCSASYVSGVTPSYLSDHFLHICTAALQVPLPTVTAHIVFQWLRCSLGFGGTSADCAACGGFHFLHFFAHGGTIVVTLRRYSSRTMGRSWG